MRHRRVAILLLGLSTPGIADTVGDVPSAWADRVAPIPPQRLAELEPATATHIRETRDRLGEMLAATEVSAAELAGVYGRLGALYGAHRMYAGAELALRNARSLDPQGFEWAYYAAHLALEQGEPEQALGYLGEAAQIDPTYPTLPLRRGEALLGLNRLQEARAAYEQVVAIPDLRAAALYGLAQIDLLEREREVQRQRLVGLAVGLALLALVAVAALVTGRLWLGVAAAGVGAVAATTVGAAAGLVVGVILVKVVNLQSFGWSLELVLPWASLGWMACWVVLACLLAGLPPALAAARLQPATVLREEG